ncbi:MAG TPA: hypothetical protein VEC12_13600 [Bacteroidia bacterium]|nr:hypothetical protein [Bacteroidia bacterium]
MKIYFYCFSILFSVIAPAGLSAQSSISFYANGALPKSQFQSSGYRNGYGMSMEYLTPAVFKSRQNIFNIRIGAGMEYFGHGKSNEVKDLVMNTPNNDKGSVYFRNEMTAFYLGPKIVFFPKGRVSPYLDIFGAIRNFNTTQTIAFNEQVEGYQQSSTTDVFKNSIGHYGASAGLLYNVSNHVSIDLRVSYSKGPSINFADLSTVKRHPEYQSNFTYDTRRFVSDVLILRVGVMFNIFECEICKQNRCNKPANTEDTDELRVLHPKQRQPETGRSETGAASHPESLTGFFKIMKPGLSNQPGFLVLIMNLLPDRSPGPVLTEQTGRVELAITPISFFPAPFQLRLAHARPARLLTSSPAPCG